MLISKRYARNLEKGGIDEISQEKLLNAKVLVMGAGGLGSGVIMNLCALGIGQIKIIDDDILEESNYNRQIIHKYKNLGRAKVISAKEWANEFNPEIKIEIDKIRINDLNYFNAVEDYDIIVDCFDSYKSKYMLNEIALRHKKILVHGGIQGFCGQVTTIVPQKTGCLSCVVQKPQKFEQELIASLSPVVSTISSIQALEVLKIITGLGEPLLNRLLVFDGLKGEFKILNFTKSIVCEQCSVDEYQWKN